MAETTSIEKRANGGDPAERPTRSMFRQISDSGTPQSRRGVIMPDDYVPELADPPRRMALYEEMRNSDEAINTAITAREKLINSSDWSLATESDEGRAVEILEFCEDNVYPVFDALLRHVAGGGLHYGFGLVENVYAWSDEPFARNIVRGSLRRSTRGGLGRKIYLRKIQHIRQKTIESFTVGTEGDDKGELLSLQQTVWNRNGLHLVDIPARPKGKLALWTYNKQGDDFFGLPPTRHIYRAWTFKKQIENLNLLGFDRFGVGVPVASAGPAWTDDDYAKMEKYLKYWRSGENTFIIHPDGGTIEIKGGDGRLYMSALEFIKWYTLSIAKTYLTQQTELGSTETGARAVGEVMYEHMEGAVQDDIEAIAALFNEELIVPLVDWNFGRQEFYPTFAPSQRVRASSAIAEVLANLIQAGAVKWDAQDEGWLREKLHMPEIDVELRQDEMDEEAELEAEMQDQLLQEARNAGQGQEEGAAAGGRGGQQARAIAKPGDRSTRPRESPADAERRKRKRSLSRGRSLRRLTGRALGSGYPGAPSAPRGIPGQGTSWRTPEYTEWEYRIVRPDLLSRDLDIQQLRAGAEVQEALGRVDEYLAGAVRELAGSGAASLSQGLRSIKVPDRLRKGVRAALAAAAERARSYGNAAVKAEIVRQARPEQIVPVRSPYDGAFSARRPGEDSPASGRKEKPASSGTGLNIFGRWKAHRNARQGTTYDASSAAAYPTNLDEARRLELDAEIDRAVEDEIDRREGSARNAALLALTLASGLTIAELIQIAVANVAESLRALSPFRTTDNVSGVVNVAFGIGRQDAADEIQTALQEAKEISVPVAETGGGGGRVGTQETIPAPQLSAKVYSAVMDFGTCDECSKWDGAEFPIDHPENATGLQAPNPRCYGSRKRCRCIWVYITAEEARARTPASRGPEPATPPDYSLPASLR